MNTVTYRQEYNVDTNKATSTLRLAQLRNKSHTRHQDSVYAWRESPYPKRLLGIKLKTHWKKR